MRSNPLNRRVSVSVGCFVIALVVLAIGWTLLKAYTAAEINQAKWSGDGNCPPDEARPAPTTAGPVPDGGMMAIAVGGNRSCAITRRQRVECWGEADLSERTRRLHGDVDAEGRLRLVGSPEPVTNTVKLGRPPRPELSVPSIVSLAQNRLAYCTLDDRALLRCSRIVTRDLLETTYDLSFELPNVESIKVGTDHACALSRGGDLWCWGSNARDQLGQKTDSIEQPRPLKVRQNVGRYAVGLAHTCVAYRSGRTPLECFGDNTAGQLGTFAHGSSPANVPFDSTRIVDLVAGHSRTCVLDGAAQVWCWGGYLALGAAENDPLRAPALSQGFPRSVVQLSAGGDLICARTADGEVWCEGLLNCFDPLKCGEGAHVVPSPTHLLKTVAPATAIGVGDRHVCALLQNGDVACLGADEHSQLSAVLPMVQTVENERCRTRRWREPWTSSEFAPVAW